MTDPTTDSPTSRPKGTPRRPLLPYRARPEAAEPGPAPRHRSADLGADPGRRSTGLADELIDRLDEPGGRRRLRWRASTPDDRAGARPLRAVRACRLAGRSPSAEALLGLGDRPGRGLERPLALGLLAAPTPGDRTTRRRRSNRIGAAACGWSPIPAVLEADRPGSTRGRAGRRPLDGPARLVRESDGLEPVLRLAALWQLADAGPVEADPAGRPLQAGPPAARRGPRPGRADRRRPPAARRPGPLWLAPGRSRRPARRRPGRPTGSSRPLVAFWAEHGVHLPQMTRRPLARPATSDRAAGPGPARRPPAGRRCCDWRASGQDDWVALDDLTADLAGRMRRDAPEPPPSAGRRDRRKRRSPSRTRSTPSRERPATRPCSGRPTCSGWSGSARPGRAAGRPCS